MKGLQGIVIAVALGLVAAFCNWYYIYRQATGYFTESFVVIGRGVQLNQGDVIKPDHLARIDIPQQNVGELLSAGILWKDRETILGFPAIRTYQPGEMFLRQDRVTTSKEKIEDRLSQDEIAFPVPVDPRTFVPDNFNPDDQVAFFVAEFMPTGQPTPVESSGGSPRNERLIGPFRILALGSRKGDKDVADASGKRNNREDVITIALLFRNGQFDEQGRQLSSQLKLSSNRGLTVVKYPKKK